MDIQASKLELLKRIALLDDESRLILLKRLLDLKRRPCVPNENDDISDELVDHHPDGEADLLSDLSIEEWEEIDRDHERAEKGEGMFFSIDEAMERLRKELGE
jgi:hypothetical protein